MSKTILISIILLFISLITHSQKWEVTFGENGSDENVKCIIETYDMGYLIDGSYNEYEYNWLIKTDINGELLWDKQIVWQDGYMYWGHVAEDSQGNIIIACWSGKPEYGQWPVIMKLNPCAELIWCKVFADYDYIYGTPMDVLVLENDDILVLAQYESQEQIDQSFLLYFDIDGNYQWRKSVASSTNHPSINFRLCQRIKQYGNSYLLNGYAYAASSSNPNQFLLRPFFAMFDSSFNESWVLPFGVEDSFIGKAYSSIQLNDSVLMGVGTRRFDENGDYLNNALMMFFDFNGQELGYTQVSNEMVGDNVGSNFILDIERIDDTLFLAACNYGPDEEGNPFGEFLIDTSGTIYGKQTKPNTKAISLLTKTSDNKYVIAANLFGGSLDWDILFYKINEELEDDSIYSSSFNYDSLCPNLINSGIIDIAGSTVITDIGDIPDKHELNHLTLLIKALPNPTNTGSIKLQYSNTEQHLEMELRCFNIHGEEVHSERIYPHQGESLIDVDSWPDGMYLAIIYSDNKPVGRVKFVVR